MIRTRDDAERAMLTHINYAIDEATTPERAVAHATIAQTLCLMLPHLPHGAPTSIADAIQ